MCLGCSYAKIRLIFNIFYQRLGRRIFIQKFRLGILGIALLSLTACGSHQAATPKSTASSTSSSQASTTKTSKSSMKKAGADAQQVVASTKGQTTAQEDSAITAHTFWSPSLKRDWHYAVYTPEQYDPTKRYPVIFLLHGMDGDYTNFYKLVDSKTLLDTATAQYQQPAIVVFADSDNSFYVDGPQEAMATAISQDLYQEIDQQYAISDNVSAHAIGGISMGGYGAVNLTFQNPQQFHYAFGISPAVWYQVPASVKSRVSAFNDASGAWSDANWVAQFPTGKINQTVQKAQPQVYLESAQGDTTVPVGDVQRFAQELQNQQIKTQLHIDPAGGHDVPYWQQALPKAYDWILQSFKNEGV
ncbi:esterase [Agrilactobacillus composti DSM 18527 = JCM 14202]|uniref:Esterase n=2 Tax=Agrilactobacillus TaxID=2767875 RepID=A0A0R1XK43_9LACO|nr:esterase [Agrilactobacillus composti DSM 18527 = JCM 14202]